MKVLVLKKNDVQDLLSMKNCIEVLREAFKSIGQEKTINPLRSVMKLPDNKGFFAQMPAYMSTDSESFFGLKSITVFPGNSGTQYHTHMGAVLLFEAKHGSLLSMQDAIAITAIRTAAASALATEYLANPHNENHYKLCILGSGTQAETHIEAMLAVRNFTHISVWSRNYGNAQKLAAKFPQLKIQVCKEVKEAVKDSDVICTVTASKDPVLHYHWVKHGCHINVVGASSPEKREVDSQIIKNCRLFTDKKESLLNEAGDFIIPMREGTVAKEHLTGELSDLVTGKVLARQNRNDITVFKSLGIAVEDVAVAHFIYKKAIKENKGTWVNFGDVHDHAKL